MPVPRKVWLQTSVVMPAALARRRTHPAGATQPALMTSSKSIAFAALHEIAVGTVIAHRPPHRPGRAQFGHPVLTLSV
jgi:hypothetical protein